MLLINDKKYACESCIKGHRSSSCAHSDRPLFEVKKKGRPASQCEKCRELRKTKRVHSRCECSTEKESKPDMKLLSQKSKRYMPILPALPNGLKDATVTSTSGAPAHETLVAQALSCGCGCKETGQCKCGDVSQVLRTHGLDVLARAAESCCSTNTIPQVRPASPHPTSRKKAKTAGSCCSSSRSTESTPIATRSSHSPFTLDAANSFSLPPILDTPSLSLSPSLFPDIPPLRTIISLAGTGCTCGVDCRCPGCVEHRGPTYAAPEHDDCSDDCHHCIDNVQGVELPPSTGYGSASAPGSSGAIADPTPSFIGALIARAAAALPPPPLPSSRVGMLLDPMNMTMYPQSLFADEGRRLGERGPAFGLVRLSKLSCCAGKCGCPGDNCGCGESCDGCCASHNDVASDSATQSRVQPSSCCSSA
ncbi:hypothetical protein PHLGIDRAFT_451232 [Phlebiopsis gigantea 11061_1 CR5-6]|uniref:Copper-fist domain-containing protein n=1 Tax=Phlebiopsis gigantea (strain 11061_1 CR5-6) TaxID=745531 RepID=A0A0C3NND7_PHLG1|nr:hypothetical protein PHLGIDRAFT_451232 [Phlebiopsis gigantea 11061_1 CR5-6]